MAYSPTLHTGSNKPVGLGNGGPTDARSYFYDETLFTYRPYSSTDEILTYLADTKYREGRFSMYVLDDSNVLKEYWFKNGVSNSNLEEKKGVAQDLQATLDAGSTLNKDSVISAAAQKLTISGTKASVILDNVNNQLLLNSGYITITATGSGLSINVGSASVELAGKFHPQGPVLDSSTGAPGTAGQLLSSTVTGTKWINPTAYEDGGVVFGKPDGSGATDKANLNWDDVNNRLGIGMTAPDVKLAILGGLRLHTPYGIGIDMVPPADPGVPPNNWIKQIKLDQPNCRLLFYNGNTDSNSGGAGISHAPAGQNGGNNYGELRIFQGMNTYGNPGSSFKQAFITFFVDGTKMMGIEKRETAAENGDIKQNITMDGIAGYNFPDDASAAAGGVKVNALYHNNGAIRMRLT